MAAGLLEHGEQPGTADLDDGGHHRCLPPPPVPRQDAAGMATSDTTAFILAGGRGSRLAPLTTVIPKPLVPVGNSSILEVLIRQLARQDITRIVVSLGYLGHL